MTYVLSGYKWGTPDWGASGGEVLWNVNSFDGLSYNTSLYDQGDFQAALQDAFDAWENAAAIDFTYTTNAAAADMDIFWTPLSGPVIGEAWISFSGYDNPGQIFDAEVRFDAEETWAPYGETDLSFYAVALHEIGHAIGLGHTDTDPDQIMYPAITSLNELGNGDIAGSQTIYGLDAGDTPADPEDPPGDPVAGGGGEGVAAGGLLGILLGLLAFLFLNPAAMVLAAMTGSSRDAGEDDDTEEDLPEGPDLGDLIAMTGTWSEEDGYFEDLHVFYEADFDHGDHDDHHDHGLL